MTRHETTAEEHKTLHNAYRVIDATKRMAKTQDISILQARRDAKKRAAEEKFHAPATSSESEGGVITFATLNRDGTTSNARMLSKEAIKGCPSSIFLPDHYNADGSCKCSWTERSGEGAVSSRIDDIQLYVGYAEPGYSSKSGIVALGNWNDVDYYDPAKKERIKTSNLPSRISEIFEKLGIEIEWSDEWSSCSDCGRLVRTQGDSYSWQPSFAEHDGELQCSDCIAEDPEEHLRSLEGNYRSCNTIGDVDPAEHGYVKVNEDSYEAGWHSGQDADPKKIAKGLEEKGIERFLFQLDENSQFYSKFSVYVHEDEADLLEKDAPKTGDDENEDKDEDDDPGVEDEDDEPGDIEDDESECES